MSEVETYSPLAHGYGKAALVDKNCGFCGHTIKENEIEELAVDRQGFVTRVPARAVRTRLGHNCLTVAAREVD